MTTILSISSNPFLSKYTQIHFPTLYRTIYYAKLARSYIYIKQFYMFSRTPRHLTSSQFIILYKIVFLLFLLTQDWEIHHPLEDLISYYGRYMPYLLIRLASPL